MSNLCRRFGVILRSGCLWWVLGGWLITAPVAADVTITVFDAGEGSASIVEFTHGNQLMVFDTGSDDAYLLEQMMKVIGDRKIDYLVISSKHDEHIGLAAHLIEMFGVREVWLSDRQFIPGSNFYRFNKTLNETLNQAATVLRQRKNTNRFTNVTFEVGKDKVTLYGVTGSDAFVVKLTDASGNKALLTGDLLGRSAGGNNATGDEAELLEFDIEAAVLLAPNHGTARANSRAFINRVQPDMVVLPSRDLNDRDVVQLYKRAFVKGPKAKRSPQTCVIAPRGEPIKIDLGKLTLVSGSTNWTASTDCTPNYKVTKQVRRSKHTNICFTQEYKYFESVPYVHEYETVNACIKAGGKRRR